MFSSRASSKIVSQKVDKSTYLRHTIDKNNNTRLLKKKLTPDVVIRDYDESKRFGSGETATYDIDEEDNVSVYIFVSTYYYHHHIEWIYYIFIVISEFIYTND
jgi:hypothetical protein